MSTKPTEFQRLALGDIKDDGAMREGLNTWRDRTMASLKARGWLDENGAITEAGLAILAEPRPWPLLKPYGIVLQPDGLA